MTVPSDATALDAQAAQAIAQDQALRQLLAGVEGLVVAQGPGPAAAYLCRHVVQLARRAGLGDADTCRMLTETMRKIT